ncbi:hypothetical protein ACIA5D_51645 [Actinoplanes sp. NPDC051513]|uniref:hypothetical protein n=1 Tax=Actinoplanes sp. NPDC051513 TaxID=3363908 RepID=UPI0037977F5C
MTVADAPMLRDAVLEVAYRLLKLPGQTVDVAQVEKAMRFDRRVAHLFGGINGHLVLIDRPVNLTNLAVRVAKIV